MSVGLHDGMLMLMNRRIICLMLASIFGLSILFFQLFEITGAKDTPEEADGFYEKIAAGDDYSYLIVGDSIGRGSGASSPSTAWFSLFEKGVSEKYGSNGERISIVQSGATAFEGFMKYKDEKPSSPVHLVFLVFGENDRKYMNEKQFSYFYEKLLRVVRIDHPAADIVTITESCLAYEGFAKEIARLSRAYGATNIDMRIPFNASGLSPDKLTTDKVHPNDAGYLLYANEIIKTIQEKSEAKNAKEIAVMPSPVNGNLGIDYKLLTNPSINSGFVNMRDGYFSKTKNSYLEYTFEGTMVGFLLERGPDGGMIDVTIDGKPAGTLATWWPFERSRYNYVASSLEDSQHTVRFTFNGERLSTDSKSGQPSVKIKAIVVEKQ